jgi:hypothetical protein
MTYKDWLDNEYRLWVQALQSSTVFNFKDHPQVKRMLSTDMVWLGNVPRVNMKLMQKIDQLGYTAPLNSISGACLRMIYYADRIARINPPSIIEVGGGVGQFYAILRALGYKNDYFIYDLPDVKDFQYKYLQEIRWQTKLETHQRRPKFDFFLSFYALGEFDDDTKEYYIRNGVNKCKHGYVVWNPHSGATERIPFEFEYYVIQQKDGSKLITW